MSNFTTSTVYTFSSDALLREAWQTVIIRDAVSNPFLLHGILAISAQHLASQVRPADVNFDYERQFRYHQDAAINQYLKALESFHVQENEEFAAHSESPWTVGPLFALSVIIVIIAVAGVSDSLLSPAALHDLAGDETGNRRRQSSTSTSVSTNQNFDKHEEVLGNIISIFVTIRGTRSLVSAVHAQNVYRDSVYRFLIDPYRGIGSISSLPSLMHISDCYKLLKTTCLNDLINRADDNCDEEYQLCRSAVDDLEYVHREAIGLLEAKTRLEANINSDNDAATCPDIGWFLKWTAMVSHGFLSLLRRRTPSSLVILAQFAAICGLAEHQWYLRNWVRNVIGAIDHILECGKGRDWLSRIVTRWGTDSRPEAAA